MIPATVHDNGTSGDPIDDKFLYTPDPDYNGTDSFTYMLTDIWGQTSTAAVSLTITAVDDAPYVDSEIFQTGTKNATATVDILSHVEDVDDTSFTLAIPTNAAHGTASVVGTVIEYVPDTDFVGVDSFIYSVNDGTTTVTGTAFITVYEDGLWASSVLAVSSQYGTEDWSAEQALGEPDTFYYGDNATAWSASEQNSEDPESPELEYLTFGFSGGTSTYATGVVIRESYGNGFVTEVELREVGGSYHSVWSGTDTTTAGKVSDLVVTFPATAYAVDAVRITINKDHDLDAWEQIDAVRLLTGGSPSSTTATVFAVNHDPVAVDDWAAGDKNDDLPVFVLANDDDGDLDVLSISSVATPTHGTVTIHDNGTSGDTSDDYIVYTPDTDYVGDDSFVYTLSDGAGGLTTATAHVHVEDGQWASSVLAKTSQSHDGTYGSSLWALGPADTFEYGDTSAAWTASPYSSAVTQTVTFGFAEPDYATGVIIRETHGNGFVTKVELRDTGNDYYTIWESTDGTPSDVVANFVITFTETAYLVNAVRITVDNENGAAIDAVKLLTAGAPPSLPTAPSAANDSATTTQGMPVVINSLGNDTNSANSRLFVHITSGPSNGAVGIDTRGTPDDSSDDVLTYYPDAYFSGSDEFTYSITDAFGQTSSATVSVTVTAVNQAPVASGASAITTLETAVEIDVLAGAFDPDEDELSVSDVSNGSHGTVVDNEDGTVTYTPAEDFVGTDEFTVTISDGNGKTTTARVQVMVYEAGQWAETVLALSSGPETPWSALGVPDGEGWSPMAGGQLEFLTLGFDTQVCATGVVIHDLYGGSAIVKVELLDSTNVYHTIFTAPATRVVAQATTGADYILDFAETAYLVKGVRITVNGQDYTAIDAVRLLTGGSGASVTLKTRGFDYYGTFIETEYNEDGLAETEYTYVAGALVQTREFEYDVENVLEAMNVIDALSRVTRTTYDTDGRVLTETLAHGTAMAATTTYTYTNGLLVSLVDALGNETTWEYDSQGREILMTDPLENDIVKTYDSEGRLASILNRNNVLRTFAYTTDGQLQTETWYAGATTGTSVVETLSWAYNADGLLTSAGNSAGTYNFEYDDLNRLVHVEEPFDVELTFGYDIWGNRNLVIDSFGGVELSLYNSNGQLVRRTLEQDSVEMRLDFTYTSEGRQESITRYSDLAGTELVAKTLYGYADGQLASLVHEDSEEDPIAEYAWVYDAAGQLIQWTDHGVTHDYLYDAQGQLISDDDGTTETEYEFDANGNRTDFTHNENYTNQLESDGAWNFSYDLEGNMTGKVNVSTGWYWEYTFNHANQLVQAEEFDDEDNLQNIANFKYDVFANRVEKIVNPAEFGPAEVYQRYAYDGWNFAKPSPIGTENWDVFADLNDDNSLNVRYLRGDVVDQIFARTDGTDQWWLLPDHLGSVRDVVDETGAVVKSVAYNAFGNVLSESGAGELGRYAWTGREFDVEIDLQYNRARYYDPTIGRWISEDPIRFAAGDGNLYRYVKNQPGLFIDPNGLLPLPWNSSDYAAQRAFFKSRIAKQDVTIATGLSKYTFELRWFDLVETKQLTTNLRKMINSLELALSKTTDVLYWTRHHVLPPKTKVVLMPAKGNVPNDIQMLQRWFGLVTEQGMTEIVRVLGSMVGGLTFGLPSNEKSIVTNSYRLEGWGRSIRNWLVDDLLVGQEYRNHAHLPDYQIATLFHEFSHFYGNTDDFGYYRDSSLVQANPVLYRTPGENTNIKLTDRQKRENADSYAGYIHQYFL